MGSSRSTLTALREVLGRTMLYQRIKEAAIQGRTLYKPLVGRFILLDD